MRCSFVLALFVVAAGCGSRTLELPRGGLAADDAGNAADTGGGGVVPTADAGTVIPTEPPGSTPLPLREGSVCSSRRDGCRSGGPEEAERTLFNAIRICAPRSVMDVCAFDLTIDFGAEGCPEAAFTATNPPGIPPETTSRFRSCVVEILARTRLTCMARTRVKPGCD